MGEVILGVLIYFLGLFIGSTLFNDQAKMEVILGTTYSELSSMKGECELTLPRNQECVASIVFLPTAIEE